MARLFRRKVLAFDALFIALTIFMFTVYFHQRNEALNLDLVYDPALITDVDSTAVNTTSRVLLVTALFPTDPQLKTQNITARISHLLGPVTTDIYLYTTPDLVSTVNATRSAGLPLTINPSFSSPFDVPPLKGRRLVYQHMLNRDPEKNTLSPEVYALRNAKPYFLENAVRSLRQSRPTDKFDYVFWVDVGSFSESHLYSHWPDPARLDKIWKDANSSSSRPKLFFPLNDAPSIRFRKWSEDSGPINLPLTEGSFFGGPPGALSWFSRTFYSYHDHFITLGYFTGRDDTIYNTVAFLFPSRIISVWASDPSAPARGGMPPQFLGRGPLGTCGPLRRYYQWWVSDRATRERMKDRWMLSVGDEWGDGHSSSRWRFNVPCRLTRVIGVEQALKTALGKSWKPPSATVGKADWLW